MSQIRRYIRTHLSPPGDVIGVQDIILPEGDAVALLLDTPHIEAVSLRHPDGQTHTYVQASS